MSVQHLFFCCRGWATIAKNIVSQCKRFICWTDILHDVSNVQPVCLADRLDLHNYDSNCANNNSSSSDRSNKDQYNNNNNEVTAETKSHITLTTLLLHALLLFFCISFICCTHLSYGVACKPDPTWSARQAGLADLASSMVTVEHPVLPLTLWMSSKSLWCCGRQLDGPRTDR